MPNHRLDSRAILDTPTPGLYVELQYFGNLDDAARLGFTALIDPTE